MSSKLKIYRSEIVTGRYCRISQNPGILDFCLVFQVFIVKDSGLLKFVFTRPPNEVGRYIKKFKEDVEKSLGVPQASLNLYDTQFYSKNDGSLDFSSTGSCFQLVGPNNYNPKDTVSLLEDPSNHELKNVYKQYEVKNIEVSSWIAVVDQL